VPSVELQTLKQRCSNLRKEYLPYHFSKTGSYSDEQLTRAAAFLLLVSAEFESYLEQLAMGLLTSLAARRAMGNPPLAMQTLAAAYAAKAGIGVPTAITEIKSDSYALRMYLACFHEARRRIEGNQGATTYNLLAMFVPLGVDETKIDPDLFTDLNAFAARRGECAHNALHDLTVLPNPADDITLVRRIIRHFEKFEKLVVVAGSA
jgi:hypothetical protein